MATVIDFVTTYSKVSCSQSATCAITTTGALQCWGDDYYGSLGIGTKYDLVSLRGTHQRHSPWAQSITEAIRAVVLLASLYVNGGNINAKGNLAFLGGANGGTTSLSLTGTSAQSWSASGGAVIPSGAVTINSSSSINLNSNISLSAAGQTLLLQSGTLNMNAFNLSINSTLTLQTGTVINKSGGNLTYGALTNNGTINP